jgi:hypothetical protein
MARYRERFRMTMQPHRGASGSSAMELSKVRSRMDDHQFQGCNLGCSSLSYDAVHPSTRIQPDLRREQLRTSADPLHSSF